MRAPFTGTRAAIARDRRLAVGYLSGLGLGSIVVKELASGARIVLAKDIQLEPCRLWFRSPEDALTVMVGAMVRANPRKLKHAHVLRGMGLDAALRFLQETAGRAGIPSLDAGGMNHQIGDLVCGADRLMKELKSSGEMSVLNRTYRTLRLSGQKMPPYSIWFERYVSETLRKIGGLVKI